MDFSLISAIVTAIAATLSTVALTIYKYILDKRKSEKEDKEVSEDLQKVFSQIATFKKEEKNDDVLTLMIKNVGELREYYIINKQQARNSFSAALFISFLGFVLFAFGVIITYFYKTDNIIQYSTISGTIVEIIAGLFFWLYSKAINQINIFHSSLLNTEKFLTAIQLVEKISPNNRDRTYNFIIEKIIDTKSSDIVKLSKNNGIDVSKVNGIKQNENI